MKKVLVFTSTFPKFTKGDATPPFVYELSQRLSQQWLDIVVLTPRVPGSKDFEVKDNMKIYRYPYFFKASWEKLNDGAILPNIKQNKLLIFQIPFLFLWGLISLIKIIKKEQIETIHAHWLVPQWLLACIYKKIWNKKIKILCTTHWWDIFGLRWKLWIFLKKFVLNTIDKLTVVSTAIKTEVQKLNPPKDLQIEVIPMWVDTDKFSPKNYDESIKAKYDIHGPFLLFVGRLAEKKWVTYLLDAMPWVIQKYPSIKLLIVWWGPLESELKQQSKQLKLDDNVIFTWPIMHQDLPKYFATADIFVWPSIIAKDGDSEGFGLVFVESLLSWCITIGSNLYWITDIIKDWKNGSLVKPWEAQDIEEKIIYCLKKLDKAKNWTIREDIVHQFSWNIIGEKYFNLLK